MPHHRFSVTGPDLAEVDGRLREARVGVVTASDATDSTGSGIPTDSPEIDRLEVIVDAEDRSAGEKRLREHLPDGCSIESPEPTEQE